MSTNTDTNNSSFTDVLGKTTDRLVQNISAFVHQGKSVSQ